MKTIKEFTTETEVGTFEAAMLDFEDFFDCRNYEIPEGEPQFAVEYISPFKYGIGIKYFDTIEEAENFWQKLLDTGIWKRV